MGAKVSSPQSMKPVRLVFIGAATIVVLLLVAVAAAFNSSVQTWAVRHQLAKYPNLHLTIGKVDAGLRRVELRDVRLERSGTTVTMPLVEANLSVLAAAF